MSCHPPGHQTRKDRERDDDSPVTTAPVACCIEFLETSVTACSHTYTQLVMFHGKRGGSKPIPKGLIVSAIDDVRPIQVLLVML